MFSYRSAARLSAPTIGDSRPSRFDKNRTDLAGSQISGPDRTEKTGRGQQLLPCGQTLLPTTVTGRSGDVRRLASTRRCPQRSSHPCSCAAEDGDRLSRNNRRIGGDRVRPRVAIQVAGATRRRDSCPSPSVDEGATQAGSAAKRTGRDAWCAELPCSGMRRRVRAERHRRARRPSGRDAGGAARQPLGHQRGRVEQRYEPAAGGNRAGGGSAGFDVLNETAYECVLEIERYAVKLGCRQIA
jgi:hypothetical protein